MMKNPAKYFDLLKGNGVQKIAQGLVLHYGCVDKFIESEDKIEQLSDPNKVTL